MTIGIGMDICTRLRKYSKVAVAMVVAVMLIATMFLAGPQHSMAATEIKKLIYDEANLLTQEEVDELNVMANELGAKRETDIIILTTDNPDNVDVEVIFGDFYDEMAPGYDKDHGNTVILTLDMRNRDVYVAGFYKGKTYIDNDRAQKIRTKITPSLSSGDYKQAFSDYIKTTYKYMGIRPGVNPDNPLFNGWFQLAVAVGIAAIVVMIMAYRSGGRVTVNRKTYEDGSTSGILDRRDQYIRTTVTKTKIEKNTGGGGGGGITGGGHSYSGSRGKF